MSDSTPDQHSDDEINEEKQQDWRSRIAADGIITGVATINADQFDADASKAAVIINDFTVLADTQGYFHHKKLDRILRVAAKQSLPDIMYTAGGGGRNVERQKAAGILSRSRR